jgi:hypothetical protein
LRVVGADAAAGHGLATGRWRRPIMRTTILSTTRGSVVAFALGLSMFVLSGCVAYEPYPATPVYYGTPYYYSAPAPSYYYQPCCASYYSFSYSHRDRGYHDRGYRGHREWRHGDRRHRDWR